MNSVLSPYHSFWAWWNGESIERKRRFKELEESLQELVRCVSVLEDTIKHSPLGSSKQIESKLAEAQALIVTVEMELATFGQ